MKHLKKAKKFHRMIGQRSAFFRGLANNLIQREKIETTEARAKAIRPIVEKYITLAKKNDVAHRRILLARLQNKKSVGHLCDDLANRYKDRAGGYTRITKLMSIRKRDGSRLATIEFV